MRGDRWQIWSMLTAVAVVLTACGGGGDAGDAAADGEQPAAAEAPAAETGGQAEASPGQVVFRGAGNCFTCHGQDATGTALAPDLTDDVWINIEAPVTAEKVVALVRSGVAEPVEHQAPMPPMGGANLSDQQIEQVAEYVLTLAGSGM